MHADHSARAADLYRAEMEQRASRERLLAVARTSKAGGPGHDEAHEASDEREDRPDEHQGQAREQVPR
ncbi:hypothetical protein DFP74_0990 [Nocardiopsis sp. Huas11]|nr:hypothetical protein DFP74_0990 [Nocardiopsis sp. Huas11]